MVSVVYSIHHLLNRQSLAQHAQHRLSRWAVFLEARHDSAASGGLLVTAVYNICTLSPLKWPNVWDSMRSTNIAAAAGALLNGWWL